MAKPFLTGKMVGAETIVGDIRRYGDTIRAKLRSEVQRSAVELAGVASTLAPRKTGALASSIKAVGMESEKAILAGVGTDIKHGMAFYGRFLESGWTPNSGQTFVGTKDVLGPWGPSSVSVKRGGVVRNPRNAKGWAAYMKQRGGRNIVAYPFLKPALAQLRGRIRERMISAVRGEG
jgi:hypothetical protein